MASGNKFSYVSLPVPRELAAEILQWGDDHVPDSQIADGSHGREDDIHITVLYGIHTESPNAVKREISGLKPLTIRLGKVSVFSNSDEYDVVKIDVHSRSLRALHALLKDRLDHTETYHEFSPHVTIAYVKKGRGWKYDGDATFDGRSFTSDALTFSSANGTVTRVGLPRTS